MIDWHAFTLDPALRRIATVLREEFGVWIGFLDAEGNQYGLGRDRTREPRLFCERMMANVLDRSSDSMTCRASTCDWVQSDAGGEDPFKRCHAGLSAITIPITREGSYLGSVYASGFLAGERAETQFDRVRELALNQGLANTSSIDALMSSIPVLDRAERGVLLSLVRALREQILELVASEPEDFTQVGDRYGDMIGSSVEMKRLFDMLRKVARGDSTVLIRGENGTGKELIARAIHRNSRRASQPFIAQNCAAIPADLIESELFGHKKGAFSGAHRDRMGLFETANHGTFFLDEIGEMEVSLQVKLLRVLQEGTFLPVGDSTFRKVDVRVLCATNRDLKKLVEAGKFREDLYYRINVISVDAPPLRHRRGDIGLLATYFLNKACHRHGRPKKLLTSEAVDALCGHHWPGNVRELENEIERAVIMTGDAAVVDRSDLSIVESSGSRERSPFDDLAPLNLDMPEAVEALERRMILEGLRRTGWNKTQTAKELGVSRRNLIRKVAALGLEKPTS